MMKNILIVDGDESTRTLLEKCLLSMTEFSFIIYKTGNGQEAWRIIKKEKIDLIISGNLMPKMSGFKLAQKVKGVDSPYKEIPFIFSSGIPGVYQKKIEEIGAINLPKPYEIDRLRELVRSLLS